MLIVINVLHNVQIVIKMGVSLVIRIIMIWILIVWNVKKGTLKQMKDFVFHVRCFMEISVENVIKISVWNAKITLCFYCLIVIHSNVKIRNIRMEMSVSNV